MCGGRERSHRLTPLWLTGILIHHAAATYPALGWGPSLVILPGGDSAPAVAPGCTCPGGGLSGHLCRPVRRLESSAVVYYMLTTLEQADAMVRNLPWRLRLSDHRDPIRLQSTCPGSAPGYPNPIATEHITHSLHADYPRVG